MRNFLQFYCLFDAAQRAAMLVPHPTLIKIAYDFEQVTKHRFSPTSLS